MTEKVCKKNTKLEYNSKGYHSLSIHFFTNLSCFLVENDAYYLLNFQTMRLKSPFLKLHLRFLKILNG